MNHKTEEIITAYYQGWARRDKEACRSVMTDDMTHRSPDGKFSGADYFLTQCWNLGEGLKAVQVVESIFTEDNAFVILNWDADIGHFLGAEYLRLNNGKISEVIVVNTDSVALTKTLTTPSM